MGRSILLIVFLFGSSSIACPITSDGYTWEFDPAMDTLIPGIPDAATCQQLCESEKGRCLAYTWQTEGPVDLCYHFSKLDYFTTCTNCVSGILPVLEPGSACAVNADELLSTTTGISEPEQCLNLCLDDVLCKNFVHFNESGIFPNTCFLYQSCARISECLNCVSGQLSCFSANGHLPDQCTNYKVLNDSTRNFEYGEDEFCDMTGVSYASSDWTGAGWYRILPPAGKVMPERSPGPRRCGTLRTGWLADSHPVFTTENKNMKLCFDDVFEGRDCEYREQVEVTNCGHFYVYKLNDAPYCVMRYCTADHFNR